MTTSRVEDWVGQYTEGSPLPGLMVSRHVDEIDPDWPRWPWSMRSVIEVFGAASSAVSADWRGRLSLAVPLGSTPGLQVQAPTLDGLAVAADEPPSLYLFSAQYFVALGNDREEYRYPYDREPWGIRDLPGVVEFVSSRGPEERSNDWEFTNDLWLHRIRPSS